MLKPYHQQHTYSKSDYKEESSNSLNIRDNLSVHSMWSSNQDKTQNKKKQEC